MSERRYSGWNHLRKRDNLSPHELPQARDIKGVPSPSMFR